MNNFRGNFVFFGLSFIFGVMNLVHQVPLKVLPKELWEGVSNPDQEVEVTIRVLGESDVERQKIAQARMEVVDGVGEDGPDFLTSLGAL